MRLISKILVGIFLLSFVACDSPTDPGDPPVFCLDIIVTYFQVPETRFEGKDVTFYFWLEDSGLSTLESPMTREPSHDSDIPGEWDAYQTSFRLPGSGNSRGGDARSFIIDRDLPGRIAAPTIISLIDGKRVVRQSIEVREENLWHGDIPQTGIPHYQITSIKCELRLVNPL